MAFTEEEAKTKWCPFTRTANFSVDGAGISENRHPSGQLLEGCNCIGSACMAWRSEYWHDTREKELWHIARNERVNGGITGEVEWRLVNPDEPPPPKTGFCGMVHQP